MLHLSWMAGVCVHVVVDTTPTYLRCLCGSSSSLLHLPLVRASEQNLWYFVGLCVLWQQMHTFVVFVGRPSVCTPSSVVPPSSSMGCLRA